MTRHTESINTLLAEFQAARAHTLSPEALAVNIGQRRELVETVDRAAFVRVGDVVESFVLHAVADRHGDGGPLSLDDLLAHGPVVLVFFRFAGCPTCNIALPHYQKWLAPGLAEAGATLVAVSPQESRRLADISLRHGFDFRVATDRDNALGRRFGILYSYNEASRRAALAADAFIGDITGTGTWELPMPATIVIGRDRRVRFVHVSPDWLERTEADDVLAAVRRLTETHAAA